MKSFKIFKEEAPVNSVAAGGIAGITGDPPVSVANQKKHVRRNKKKILRRKSNSNI